MARIMVRSLKRVNAEVMKAIKKDREAAESLARIGRGMLKLCRELKIEPETALCDLYYLAGVAERALMTKHRHQMAGDSHEPIGKKQMRALRKDYKRVRGAVLSRVLDKLKIQSVVKGRESLDGPKGLSAPSDSEETDSRHISGDKRPVYIQ